MRGARRYAEVSDQKARGATYTPQALAAYLAERLVAHAAPRLARAELRVLDPAIGDGALALALLGALAGKTRARVVVHGFETDAAAAGAARRALRAAYPDVDVTIHERSFLAAPAAAEHDLVIANPPYVRTQILGAADARGLAARYGLEGRLDLYQAFTLATIEHLAVGGALALITSNRFLTTQGAAAFRRALAARLEIARLWDLGDTRLFAASILPAMLVATRGGAGPSPTFTSIYETDAAPHADARVARAPSAVVALDIDGDVRVGRRVFAVRQGSMETASRVWRLSSARIDRWLAQVARHTWQTFGDVGPIRVGVKTTADSVFIRAREAWCEEGADAPELLRPLLTHHVAARFCAPAATKLILYPHLDVNGRREVADLAAYPNAARYLARHRAALERRAYLRDAGRRWYEIWVPHEPAAWARPKLVFRDIAETPTFFVDRSGSVVNGDCYWLVAADPARDDVLWLALAVASSSFVTAFYDASFPNKLYAGRRRFMKQYVERFPLPDPTSPSAVRLSTLARARYASRDAADDAPLEAALERLVWTAFGLDPPARISM